MDVVLAEQYMREALKEAECSLQSEDVPVGAVVVYEGSIIARAHNEREKSGDATAHAEILAIRRACEARGGWYLHDCTLICTMEPCPMCAGAAIQARMQEIVFGALDVKCGCCGTKCDLTREGLFPYRINVMGGVLAKDCVQLLKDFFRQRRPKAGREMHKMNNMQEKHLKNL